MKGTFWFAAASMAALAACGGGGEGTEGGARDRIRVVGSSTVYPFSTLAAERFVSANPRFKAPVVESTGTGAGMKLFCAGLGAGHPDIEDASRRIKKSEYDTCQKNGVGPIVEIQVGIDGIAFAEAKSGPKFQLTPADIYRALAANPGGKPNTAKTWRDVDAALPATPIQVYGPPSTSGTRDALAELILAKGCEATDPGAKALKARSEDDWKKRCTAVREDGAYVDAGENDNLIVQKLTANPNALGIFGYSYLEENAATVNGVPIAGVAPTYATIASGRYPGARPLYLYVKKQHVGAIPGLAEFLATYATLWDPDGPLVRRGLIAASDAVRAKAAATAKSLAPMGAAELK